MLPLDNNAGVSSLDWSPISTQKIIAGSRDGVLRLFDANAPDEVTLMQCKYPVLSAKFTVSFVREFRLY